MYKFLRSCTADVGPDFPFMKALKYLGSNHTWEMVHESQSSPST